jgi:RNA polymerase sigma-70 factor (ECF subfamily)
LIGVRLGSREPHDSEWEARCVERVRRGSRDAFAELYGTYAPRLYAQILLPRLGNAAAAEEALAETFRAALENLDRYQPQAGGFERWLTTIAVHKATDVHRERTRSGKAIASFEALVGPLRDGDVEGRLVGLLDQGRLQAAVARTMAEILPRYRRAIELRVLEDLPRPDCARQMEITVGNFDVVLLRALRAFRAAWIAKHGEEGR